MIIIPLRKSLAFVNEASWKYEPINTSSLSESVSKYVNCSIELKSSGYWQYISDKKKIKLSYVNQIIE